MTSHMTRTPNKLYTSISLFIYGAKVTIDLFIYGAKVGPFIYGAKVTIVSQCKCACGTL